MSEVVIRVEKLGKRYPLGGVKRPYETIRDSVGELFFRALNRVTLRKRAKESSGGSFWALKDVSMEIRRGEVVGIIGRNGAGKSTLLKLLSRVTEPSRGWAELHGKVGSLLEVGTGFHLELSGRENVLLCGAMLGMRRSEVLRKLDEIVAFAEVEKFLDTPVKHYSSGMYLRLGFAVAAHLETDILLVDEVLAVGDASFQKRCVEKISRVAREGRTVLFVSHSMTLVNELCTRTYLLSGGMVEASGETSEVLGRYLSHAELGVTGDLASIKDRRGSGRLRLQSLHFEDHAGVRLSKLPSGGFVRAVLKLKADGTQRRIRVCVFCRDQYQQQVLYLNSFFSGPEFEMLSPGDELVCEVPKLHLAPGRYRVGLWIQTSATTLQDRIDDAGVIEVVDGGFFGRHVTVGKGMGVALMDYCWTARAQERVQ